MNLYMYLPFSIRRILSKTRVQLVLIGEDWWCRAAGTVPTSDAYWKRSAKTLYSSILNVVLLEKHAWTRIYNE